MKIMEENGDSDSAITVEDVQKLVRKKDEIEEQIKAYFDVLEDQGMDMRGPLVDVEGYPLSDVDLYQVRTARHHISRLQNDHKAIMLEIEEALHRLHARERARRDRDDAGDLALCPAFAKVDTVAEGSPASQSGLRVGDEIIEFGSVNSRNFQNLQNIATVVQHSEGVGRRSSTDNDTFLQQSTKSN